jgi:5,6-dimethylbenzimidazole synthase
MNEFSKDFQNQLLLLMQWRRDVRSFRRDSVDECILRKCLVAFQLAPSVGLSEPWRLVRLSSAKAKNSAIRNFESANAAALAGYSGDLATQYASLKLSGMRDAPVQIAVFADENTDKGAGLGRQTMPEMLKYSVVGAVTLFWIAARSRGLGVGWVSILDAAQLKSELEVPDHWALVAYLCIGWPLANSLTPELEILNWESRAEGLTVWIK